MADSTGIITDDASKYPEKNWITGEELLELFNYGALNEVCDRIFSLLENYEKFGYTQLNPVDQQRIDDTVSAIFYIFTRPDFQIPNDRIAKLMGVHHLFCNLVACSSYRTADQFIKHILNQKDNYFKLLFLYSCRCKRTISVDTLFSLHAPSASVWWLNYGTAVGAPVTELLWNNLNEHYARLPKGFVLPDARTVPAVFDCTYFNPDCDGIIKTELNKQCQRHLTPFKSESAPVKGKVIWITARWYPTSSVYRCSKPYLDRLADKYDVTLVHLGKIDERLDQTTFKKVVSCPLENNTINASAIKDHDADLAIFPDVGMSNESVIMSNLRLAPKTLCLYGHASSTFSPEMDYWMGGTELEVPELAHKHYSERLLLVKGVGMMPVYPSYKRRYPQHDKDRVVINCSWTGPKISYPTIAALKKIVKQASKKVFIKIYPAFTLGRYNSLMPTIVELSKMFGDELTVMAERPYDDYMAEMEYGDISLMAHPFGGYTTVVDAFLLGQPVIAVEGNRMFNKMAPAMLRQVGLPWCVAKNLDELVKMTVCLIDHPERLKAAREHLEGLDLRAKLATTANETDLLRTVDFIYENHDRIMASGERGPFYIP